MGKNMNLIPSLLLFNKHKDIWLWPWPSCRNHPKTLSFRATTDDSQVDLRTLGSFFTNSSESVSMSTVSENFFDNNDQCSSSVETIVRGVKSERLFFEPDPTSSILETQGSGRQCTPDTTCGGGGVLPYKQSVALVVESENPYRDFKKSMEEMVESQNLKDWDCLEELLGWYLRTNGKNNHEFIVGAFVDLLAGISGGGGSDHSVASFSSVASTFSSPISSPLSQVGKEKFIEEGKMVIN